MRPRRSSPGIFCLQIGGEINGIELIVYELADIPRQVIMPENEKKKKELVFLTNIYSFEVVFVNIWARLRKLVNSESNF